MYVEVLYCYSFIFATRSIKVNASSHRQQMLFSSKYLNIWMRLIIWYFHIYMKFQRQGRTFRWIKAYTQSGKYYIFCFWKMQSFITSFPFPHFLVTQPPGLSLVSRPRCQLPGRAHPMFSPWSEQTQARLSAWPERDSCKLWPWHYQLLSATACSLHDNSQGSNRFYLG